MSASHLPLCVPCGPPRKLYLQILVLIRLRWRASLTASCCGPCTTAAVRAVATSCYYLQGPLGPVLISLARSSLHHATRHLNDDRDFALPRCSRPPNISAASPRAPSYTHTSVTILPTLPLILHTHRVIVTGSLIFAVLTGALLILTGFARGAGVLDKDNTAIASIVISISGVCMWIFWICSCLHQVSTRT